MATFSVGGYDYGGEGRGASGYGQKDIDWLKGLGTAGPSAFQYRQLYQRAKKEGLSTGPAVQAMMQTSNVPGVGAIPRQQAEVGFNYGDKGGWGFGGADLDSVVGGGWGEFSTEHLDRVQELRNWAFDQKIGVGPRVDSWLESAHGLRKKEMDLQAGEQDLINRNDELLARAREAVPVHEPPKPKFRGAGGHFVPGTTRFQGQESPTRRARGTMKSRFRRTGQGFQSALSISGGNQGATQSKVLNV